jgi:long-chain acyl-CoA synthetase
VLNFVENPETIPENVREIQPTVFTRRAAGVGEVLFRRDDRPEGGQPVQQLAYGWAIGVGTRMAALVAGQPVGPACKLRSSRLARFLVLNNVRKLIGIHRCRFL